MNGTRNPPDSDLDKLSRLKALSWLSASELGLLTEALALTNFKRPQIIFREAALAPDAHILLQGIARITCQNARGERVTIALLAPGPIPEFPSPPFSRFNFRCEAYNDCRVGTLSWDDFSNITHSTDLAFKKFHQNDLQQCYRLLLRSSSFFNLGLHERIAITLLELASDFGIKESRGALLRASFSHQDLADLVGASRPRVTEHLAQLEREHLVIRQGRQLIVCMDEMGNAIAIPPARGTGPHAYFPGKERPFVTSSKSVSVGR
ncbi:MAG TPA: Crp/Fnr family transcriptional regulator [Candidatus Angelobacter sp.]|nr:Crp/Fnr family transcriptional regulator [Candidatus Angelobacter sp.]